MVLTAARWWLYSCVISPVSEQAEGGREGMRVGGQREYVDHDSS